MMKVSESVIKVVRCKQAQMVETLEPKGEGGRRVLFLQMLRD